MEEDVFFFFFSPGFPVRAEREGAPYLAYLWWWEVKGGVEVFWGRGDG